MKKTQPNKWNRELLNVHTEICDCMGESSSNSRVSLNNNYQHFSKKTRKKRNSEWLPSEGITWEKSSLSWRIRSYNQPINFNILAYSSWTSQVTEQISNRCALHIAVNNSEENNKMLSQVNLPVPMSHKCIWFCNCRIKNFGTLTWWLWRLVKNLLL